MLRRNEEKKSTLDIVLKKATYSHNYEFSLVLVHRLKKKKKNRMEFNISSPLIDPFYCFTLKVFILVIFSFFIEALSILF